MMGVLFTLWLFGTVETSDIAELQVQTVRRGDDTTIRCGQKAELKELAWYKERLGKLPQYVVRKVITGANSSPGSKSGIYHRFNPGVNHSRFSVDEEKFDLSIKGVKEEDIGIYLCGNGESRSLKFISGTLLLFAEEKTDHHPPPEPDKHQCSVQTVTLSCSGEHSVYWIRHGSGEPHPGIIYTPRYTSDECESSSKTDSSTQSCVYKLPKRNLSLSDAGTYYCAVAACGPETKSTGKGKWSFCNNWTVVALITSNALCVIVMVVLGGLLWKKQQKVLATSILNCWCVMTLVLCQVEDTEGLNYAAVNFVQRPPSRSPRVKESQDIYSQVKENIHDVFVQLILGPGISITSSPIHPVLLQVLSCLLEKQLFIKAEKCELRVATIMSCRDICSAGVIIDDLKTDAAAHWPVPQSTKELQRFLGFALSDTEELQVQTVKYGENVTVKCDHNFVKVRRQHYVAWYKQSFGKQPQLIVRSAESNADIRPARAFAERFRVTADEGKFDLSIINTVDEDTGTYFCVKLKDYAAEFGSGTLLLFTDERSQQSDVTEVDVKSGESVTLQCSVASLSCSGEHSVYWYRHGSGESHPGIIYTHGNRSDQCKSSSKTDSSTQSCVYKLPKRNLSLSDAGTYYCAVAACGQILFGDGTKLSVKGRTVLHSFLSVMDFQPIKSISGDDYCTKNLDSG
ncbi:hypothetical protein NFI96_031995 [Prochilodus magdalenae]|nr:hypothetical protein NFI96_031995 [Prochilodus magdalenae]